MIYEDYEPTDAQLDHYSGIGREIISPRDNMIQEMRMKSGDEFNSNPSKEYEVSNGT